MPAHIRSFFHDSVQAPASPPTLGTAFDVADVHEHDLLAGAVPFLAGGPFVGRIESIHLRLSSISGATKVSVRLCLDEAGDYTVVPDVAADIAPGVTTATTGCVAFKVGIPVQQILGGGTLYLFAKVDSGSAVMAQSCITWTET